MTSKVDTPKRARRHSFSSLEEVAREIGTKQQPTATGEAKRSSRKRSQSPNAASEGSSLKKAALSTDTGVDAEDYLCLPGG